MKKLSELKELVEKAEVIQTELSWVNGQLTGIFGDSHDEVEEHLQLVNHSYLTSVPVRKQHAQAIFERHIEDLKAQLKELGVEVE